MKAYINVGDVKSEEYIKRPATKEDVDNELAENIGDLVDRHYIIMCTKKGVIKKTKLEAYSRPRTNGINAIGIREGDELLEVKLTGGKHEVLMALKSGRAIRFNEEKVRPMGRTASGVRGITLSSDSDEVVGMVTVADFTKTILVVSEKGYGKRTLLNDPETSEAIYRVTNRGGKGVKTLNVTDKTGNLVAIKVVTDEDDLMIINKSGVMIRMHVDSLRTMGRATQGVKLIDLRGKDTIAAVAKVEKDDSEDEIEDVENLNESQEGENPSTDENSSSEDSSTEESSEE